MDFQIRQATVCWNNVVCMFVCLCGCVDVCHMNESDDKSNDKIKKKNNSKHKRQETNMWALFNRILN